jgi:hypothetical protein
MSYFTKRADSNYSNQIEEAVEKAKSELKDKTLKEVQIATAITWCGRAIFAADKKSEDAIEYAHEAIEHAALSGDDALLKIIREKLRSSKIDI